MKLRPYRGDDFAAVHRLLDACTREWRGEPYAESELRTWLATPGLDIHTDIRLAERDGELAGYVDVDRSGDPPLWWCDVRVLPGEDTATIAPELLRWAGERAATGRLRVWASARDAALREAVERAGFAVRRHSFSMEIDLDDLRDPEWPDGIRVRTYREGDGPLLYEAEHEVWLDTWSPLQDTYEQWAHWTIDREIFDPELWFVAEAGDELAGFAFCSRSESREDTGWVDILGVRRPWRRQGLGEALLRQAFLAFSGKGLTRAGLGVDAESPTGATRLYERAGMRVYLETVVYEQELRA